MVVSGGDGEFSYSGGRIGIERTVGGLSLFVRYLSPVIGIYLIEGLSRLQFHTAWTGKPFEQRNGSRSGLCAANDGVQGLPKLSGGNWGLRPKAVPSSPLQRLVISAFQLW
jgi:hypothetical protein